MQVLLFDKNRIKRIVLPSEPVGSYSIDYFSEGSQQKKLINIEAIAQEWVIRSNGEIQVIKQGIIVSRVELQEYQYCMFKAQGAEEEIVIFCAPTTERNEKKLSINCDKITIGSTNDNIISLNNGLVQSSHAVIYKEYNEWYISVPGEDADYVDETKCYTYLNDRRVTKNHLKMGDQIFVCGLKIIWLNSFMIVNNPEGLFVNKNILPDFIQGEIDNTKYTEISEYESNIELYKPNEFFYPSVRMAKDSEEATVKIDSPPSAQVAPSAPLIITLGSSVMLLGSATVMGMNLFNTLSNPDKNWRQVFPQLIMIITMIIGSFLMPQIIRFYQKYAIKRREKLRQTKYTIYVQSKVKTINTVITEQKNVLHENYPSLGECYGIAFSNSKSKWARLVTDDDFLNVRVGSGSLPAKLKIAAREEGFTLEEDNLVDMVTEIATAKYTLEGIPITFSFLENRNTAMICNTGFEQDYLNGLILQLVTFHSAADLKLVFLLNSSDVNKLKYTKYLPHCLSDTKEIRFFANDLTEMKTVCSYLEEEFNARKNAANGETKGINKDAEPYVKCSPYYLIITDDYLSIKNMPGIDKIINSELNYGFSFLIYDSSSQRVPNKCRSFLQILKEGSYILETNLNQIRFNAEYDDKIDMRSVSNVLSNIPIQKKDSMSSLPESLTFLQMYNVSKIDQLNVVERWTKNNPIVSLQAPIGVQTNGEHFFLDLHEKYHGPHGLIAGTTGSGKSEFIITYLLSLSLNYHPDEVQFVIIDYKGGGLAGAFENRQTGAKIPHLVGTITNLDVSEMNRTLVSINSELKRRQKVFNEARDALGEGSMDIYKYQKFYREGMVKEPMSHLLIVSDEFAELKSQQPDFMDELISAARIGRSLGVHLILATQKPSGVVTDQIWSNSKFKICLKVQDTGDSNEMLKRPDAASLKQAGRFYLQVGYDEYFDIGQAAWAGAKYVPSYAIAKKQDDSLLFIDNTGYTYKKVNDVTKKEAVVDSRADQLTSIVGYIIEVAKKENYVSKQLWRSIIPGEIFIRDLKIKYNYARKAFRINPVIGEYDNPTAQFQGVLTLDISGKGNTLIYGMQGSGKENLLSTIIYSTVVEHHPAEVNFYIIDMGAETLRVFEKMPHVGDVCLIDDGEKILDLLNMLNKEMLRRKQLFVEYNGSYSNYCQNSGSQEPSIIVMINNYEVFVEIYEKYSEMLPTMYRDGNKLGIYFILTTSMTNSIKGRTVEFFNNKICLQMPNSNDYRDLLGAPRNLLPIKLFGRGIVALEHGQFEFQTAYIYTPLEINNVIKQAITAFAKYDYKAKRIPTLPEVVTSNLLADYVKDISQIPIGINSETKEVCLYNFTKNKVNAICTVDMEDHIGFFHALIDSLNKDENLIVAVIDAVSLLNQNVVGKEYYNNNFEMVLEAITTLIKNEENSPKNFLYVFLGIGELKSKLSPAAKETFNNIFANANTYNKTSFIVIDNSDSYKNFKNEMWHDSIVDKKAGIWLGYGVEDQFILTIPNLSADDRKMRDSNYGFYAVKNHRILFKKVVLNEEENHNEQ